MYSKSMLKGWKMAGRQIKGRFRKTTRQYSGLLRAVPGTERYRLTELHRRFNRDMNSASVSLFSTRETRERERKKGKRQTNRRQCSLLLLSSQLLMYSLLSRGEEHSPHAHFSQKLPVYGGQTAPCEVTGQMLWLQCNAPEIKCMV